MICGKNDVNDSTCSYCVKIEDCEVIVSAIDNYNVDAFSFSCSMIETSSKLKIKRGDIDD